MTSDPMITSAEEPGEQPRPARPFIPGREAGQVPVQAPARGFARPFRTGGVPELSATAAPEVDSAGSERGDVPDRLPGTWIEEVTPAASTDLNGDEQPRPEVGEESESTAGTTFAPLLSWDPLTDVGWRADQAAELDVEVGALAFPHTSVTETDTAVRATPDTGPIVEGVAPEDGEFAEKLELIAEAIRGGKVEGLLAERPQDALTALVVGYYLGTVRRGGASGR